MKIDNNNHLFNTSGAHSKTTEILKNNIVEFQNQFSNLENLERFAETVVQLVILSRDT